jgi:hypothetical protein
LEKSKKIAIINKEITSFILLLVFLFSIGTSFSKNYDFTSQKQDSESSKKIQNSHFQSTKSNVSLSVFDDQNDLSDEEFELKKGYYYSKQTLIIASSQKTTSCFKESHHSALKIPLYILFCNFKLHLQK